MLLFTVEASLASSLTKSRIKLQTPSLDSASRMHDNFDVKSLLINSSSPHVLTSTPPSPPPSPYTRDPATDIITPNPNFVAADYSADDALLNARLTQFFGVNGLSVNTIVAKVTNCQTSLFNAKYDFIERAKFRFANIMKLIEDLAASPADTMAQINVSPVTDPPAAATADERATWVANKIQNIITVTIADIAGVAVRSLVGVGQDCNDAAKNLYKYVYHRYS